MKLPRKMHYDAMCFGPNLPSHWLQFGEARAFAVAYARDAARYIEPLDYMQARHMAKTWARTARNILQLIWEAHDREHRARLRLETYREAAE